MNDKIKLPVFDDITAAASRIEGQAVHTPLLNSAYLDDIAGCRVFLKPECLQRTGSFKFRGAFNTISLMTEEDRKSGVVAVSSGNHAQGVADAARIHGIPATIIMPADAPQTKIDRTRRLGAEVILYDRANEDREAIAAEHCRKTGAAFIHPFNDPRVIAGQGTAGLEACQDIVARGETLEEVLVPAGGGGLAAGTALSVSHHFAHAAIHTCEPEGFDDYCRSLVSGRPEENPYEGGSVCDAILTPRPGEISFAINSQLAGEGFTVTDEQALQATAFAFRELKLVVEPGGAVALASLFKHRGRLVGKTVLVVLSGGNMDPEMLQRAADLPEIR